MAKIEVTPEYKKEVRKLLINGIEIPDVLSVSLEIKPNCVDEVVIRVLADSFSVISK